jgi:hypothetical protein
MTMKGQVPRPRIESRWPVGLAIVAAVVLLSVLPRTLRLAPAWLTYIVGLAVLVPMAAVALTAGKTKWLRAERAITLLVVIYGILAALTNLTNLIAAMVKGSVELSGAQLLASGIAVWVSNVLIFSLLYWHMDRGGPESRVNDASKRPDWLFPQEGAPEEHVRPGWRPAFVDYLFLGYSTATAFSTTDVIPLTARAKLLMMLESSISLVTMVVVASRAINILGS